MLNSCCVVIIKTFFLFFFFFKINVIMNMCTSLGLMYRGRGIWRCLYDANSSLLITAGFDSAIKVHQLHGFWSKGSDGCAEVKEFIDRTEIFTARIPTSSEHNGLMDR